MTSSMPSISSFANRARISRSLMGSSGLSDSSLSPTGTLFVIGNQALPFVLRVLMTPSTEVAAPPGGAGGWWRD